MLIIFGGLPGTGKTTISKQIAQQIKATYLRVDTVEQVLNTDGPEGYEVCYALASENLRLGLHVVADSVNAISITREAWRTVAQKEQSVYVEIELICSNKKTHQHRIESRTSDIPGHALPIWMDVTKRDYEPWKTPSLIIDTTKHSVEESVRIILEYIASVIQRKKYE